MKILRQKSFSANKKKPEYPSKVEYLTKGAILSYSGGKLGKNLAKGVSGLKQTREVMERVKTELPKRAAAGDQRAAEALSAISSNPRFFALETSKRAAKSPRTLKAGKKGMIVGAAIPATLTTTSYIRKKKKYEDSKKKNKE